MRFSRYLAVVALGVTIASCDLEVTNVNNPDRPRILASPAEVEALASAQFQQIISAISGNFNSPHSMMRTMAFENTSSLFNSGMGPRSAIPRGAIDNSVGNREHTENFREFRLLSGVARNGTDILIAMDAEDFTLGAGREADELRLRSFAHFVTGVAYGYIAMTYDSTGIARPDDPVGFEPPLEGYQDVIAFAVAQLDEALAVSQQAPGMSAIPGGAGAWLTGPNGPAVAPARYREIINTFKAHLLADHARTVAEREAVNWTAVRDAASAGLTSDLVIQYDPPNGWSNDWLLLGLHFRDANWHQMGYYIIGMADVTGAYDTWLRQDRDTRVYFLIQTPDQRFPQGASRAAQVTGDAALPGVVGPNYLGQYFRNRPPDQDEGTTSWRASMYDHWRFKQFAEILQIGPFPLIPKAQNDLLLAEAHVRLNNPGGAVPLINNTRVANGGLPGVTGAGTVPGGAQCVPQVPAGPGQEAGLRCGNLMEAMMWERWIETAFTSYGAWFFVNRGWGILPEGTPFQWPVPNQELNARLLPIYNMGGVGLPGGAAPSIYGFGTGSK
jgi:hypothetical protein